MELLLLLLVIFLQLGGGLGWERGEGGRGWQGWEWVTAGRGLMTLQQPQPAVNWAPGAEGGSLTGAVTQTPPRREMSALPSGL